MASAEAFRVCPSCGRTNGASHATCQGCGLSLSGVPLRLPSEHASDTVRPVRSPHHDPLEGGRPFVPLSEEELYPPAERGGTTGRARRGGPTRLTERRRPWAAFVIGLILVVAGAVIIAGIYVVNATPQTRYLEAKGSTETIWTLEPATLTELTARVHWFGGFNGTHLYLVYLKPDCTIPAGVVAVGVGASGTFKAPLDPGTTYTLYSCNAGVPSSINATVSLYGGLTLGELVAGFTIAIGFGLIAIGLRGHSVVVHPRTPS